MTRPNANTRPEELPSGDYQNAVDYLYGRINYEKLGLTRAAQYPFRLQRMEELFKALGLQNLLYQELDSDTGSNPQIVRAQDSPAIIHIAGTKGKGSTASLLASACTESGFRTGLYTSPHLNHLEERFQVDGNQCNQEQFIKLVEAVRDAAERIEPEHGNATFFEFTTAMAMLYFTQSQCEIIVAEVGLGGRLDSTNVLKPTVSVITSIGLDHQHVLGDNIESIAKEKAGIIKPVAPVVSGVEQQEAKRVVQSRCQEHETLCFQLGTDFHFRSVQQPEWGSEIELIGQSSPLPEQLQFSLAMEGEHQAKNAAVAAVAYCLLKDFLESSDLATPKGHACKTISEQSWAKAVSETQAPARLERFVLPNGMTIILDASHNEDSIRALVDSLHRRDASQKLVTIFGTSQDKDAAKMVEILKEINGPMVLTEFQTNPRRLTSENLLQLLPEEKKLSAHVVRPPLQACQYGMRLAEEAEATLVICGSFFLAAETRDWVITQSATSDLD